MKKKRMIDVLVVRPMMKPEMVTIEASLNGYYELNDCEMIEAVYPFDDPVALVCDEEGKLTGRAPNRALKQDGKIYDVIFGTFFICGIKGSDFSSLSEELAEKYTEMFRSPEMYLNVEGKVMRIVMDGSEEATVIN